MSAAYTRTADYPIEPMFLERWSPRAFNGDTIAEADLLTMLEAARWAASSYNVQPWRFIYARRDTPRWETMLDLLLPFNRAWAKDAAALVILVSNSLMRPPGKDEEVPSPTHSFDTGAASGYFALQASKMGWYTHGMSGFDRQRALIELNVPAAYTAEAAFVVGHRGDPASLPEALQAREQPNDRLPLTAIAFEGAFQV